jgi:DNA-binding NarL/FixJ family response regulator
MPRTSSPRLLTGLMLSSAARRDQNPAPYLTTMEAARPSSIRVLLVDDHRILTDTLAQLLTAEDDISVVGSARSVADLMDDGQPDFDVAVMDYLLPDGNGADATSALKRRWPNARVIILSALTDDHAIARATRAGADAYLGKDTPASILVEAIRAARSASKPMPRDRDPAPVDRLTPRERQILQALTLGRSTREICVELGIAPNTVRSHVQNLMGKLRVHSKLEAVSVALRHRIV